VPRVHTHYDNLKVARDAPIEVIRAAYKSLSLKYHPDLTPGNEKAARITRIINASYEVLSDPARRAVHDRWIVETEAESPEPDQVWARRARQRESAPPQAPPSPPPKFATQEKRNVPWISITITVVVLALGVFAPSTKKTGESPSAPRPPATAQTKITPPTPIYARPSVSPNGSPWPAVSAYLPGEPQLNDAGDCIVTIDNTGNSTDAHVKLYEHGIAVRQFFLRARGQFTMMNVRAGTYLIHYKDLDSEDAFESEPFTLREDAHAYSTYRLTLYTVPFGNTKPHRIDSKDF
jgi:curved DNA-binding protein CbpA